MNYGWASVDDARLAIRFQGRRARLGSSHYATPMFELINTGGPMFMVPLTLLLLAVIGLIIAGFVKPDARRTALLLHVGVFAAVWGILGQTLGLISALDAIEAMGGVSPAMLAGGLKVSFVTTVTGLSVLTLALAGWTAIRYRSGG